MSNDRKLRIVAPRSMWSWKRRLIVFVSIFGSIWLFIEPLLAFIGSANPLNILGGWQYLILCIVSGVVVALAEIVEKQISVGRVSFVDFVITLIESGEQYHVEAPYDMRTKDFVDLFMNTIFAIIGSEGQLSRYYIYDNTLMIKQTNGSYIASSGDNTLKENGIVPGSDCRVEGTIKSNHVHVAYLEKGDRSFLERLKNIIKKFGILVKTTSKSKGRN